MQQERDVPLFFTALVIGAMAAGMASPGCSDERAPTPQPDPDPWRELNETQLTSEIEAGLSRAREEHKSVLLEFVAPWCEDCREVIRISRLDPAKSEMARRYVTVYVNVGRFDRHRELLAEHQIRSIAALVVLDDDGRQRFKTTLEPISRGEPLRPEALAAWLRAPSNEPPRTASRASEPLPGHLTDRANANDPPAVFPAEIVPGAADDSAGSMSPSPEVPAPASTATSRGPE